VRRQNICRAHVFATSPIRSWILPPARRCCRCRCCESLTPTPTPTTTNKRPGPVAVGCGEAPVLGCGLACGGECNKRGQSADREPPPRSSRGGADLPPSLATSLKLPGLRLRKFLVANNVQRCTGWCVGGCLDGKRILIFTCRERKGVPL
jgi:hypothetical protein